MRRGFLHEGMTGRDVEAEFKARYLGNWPEEEPKESLGSDRDWMYERRLREQQPQQTHFSGQDAIRRLNDAIKPMQEDPNQNPKTYCLDFDGVLHYHETGSGAGPLGELLEPGIALAKRIKAAGHKLVILTARPEDQHHMIQGWLKGHGVKADEVTNVKPPAEMYIDDRAEHYPRNFGHQENEPPPSGQGPSIDIARKASNREGGPGSGPRSGGVGGYAKSHGFDRPEKEKSEKQKQSVEKTRIKNLHKDLTSAWVKSGRKTLFSDFVKSVDPSNAKDVLAYDSSKESRESRIDHFGENSGDGAINMLDGHHYRSLATHESKKRRKH